MQHRGDTRFNDLQAENAKLAEEVSRGRDEAQTEAAARQQAQEKLDQVEGDLRASRILAEKLTQQNIHLTSKVKKQKRKLGRSEKYIEEALQVLHRLSPVRSNEHET